MSPRNRVPFSLRRRKIRQSWNKYNLYNLLMWNKAARFGTLYQQIYSSKQETRAYHGEKLTETQLRNMFTGKLKSVRPLASGDKRQQSKEIPRPIQSWSGLERRLDTAVFRALFATSTRHASQLVLKGYVSVNGIKIKQPGYPLEAGDVFAVAPKKVLEAVGRQKPNIDEAVRLTNKQIAAYNRHVRRCKKYPKKLKAIKKKLRVRHPDVYSKIAAARKLHLKKESEDLRKEAIETIFSGVPPTPIDCLKDILSHERAVKTTKGNQFPEFAFNNEKELELARSIFSRTTGYPIPSPLVSEDAKFLSAEEQASLAQSYFTKGSHPHDYKAVRSDLEKLTNLKVEHAVKMVRRAKNEEKKSLSPEEKELAWYEKLQEVPKLDVEEVKSAEDLSTVKVGIPFGSRRIYGLAEPKKPYFTPWTARQFMAPFAIMPNHIEVSFKSCHAVYLRDPLARPGQSEVISPFPLNFHEFTHMFYNRKRRKNLHLD